MKTFFAAIGILVVLFIFALFALCNDDENEADSWAPALVASHDYRGGSDCYQYGDCRGDSGNEGEYRDDNRRGGISPGPFDRSPVDLRDNRVVICFPFSRCDAKDGEGDPPPNEV